MRKQRRPQQQQEKVTNNNFSDMISFVSNKDSFFIRNFLFNFSLWIKVCVFENIEYTGRPYKGMNPYRVNSFQECYDDFVAKNKADDTCRAFTFRGSNGGGDCLLKHWKGNENQSDGATSGTIINCN